MNKQIALGLILTTLLAGCATVDTKPFATQLTNRAGLRVASEGIGYNLPKSQFALSISNDKGNIIIAIVAPLSAADPEAAMITRLPVGIISNNEFEITISDRNLLTSGKGYSDGQLTLIVENAIKSTINTQSADGGGAVEFFRKNYDFSNFSQAVSEGNEKIRSFIATNCPGATSLAGDDASKKQCVSLRRLIGSVQSASVFFDLSVIEDRGTAGSGNLLPEKAGFATDVVPVKLGECPRDALCYHPLVPATLTLTVPGHFSKSDSYLIVDKSRLAYVKPRGGVFAKQEYAYTFNQGVLTGYKQVSKSELVGLVSLPLTIVKSIISAPAEALASKTSALDAETKYLESQQKNIDSQKKVAATCKENPGLCTSSTVRLLGATAGTSDSTESRANSGGNTLGNEP
jgi:hypothetical protein